MVEKECQRGSGGVRAADDGQSGVAAEPLVVDIFLLRLVVCFDEVGEDLLC